MDSLHVKVKMLHRCFRNWQLTTAKTLVRIFFKSKLTVTLASQSGEAEGKDYGV